MHVRFTLKESFPGGMCARSKVFTQTNTGILSTCKVDRGQSLPIRTRARAFTQGQSKTNNQNKNMRQFGVAQKHKQKQKQH